MSVLTDIADMLFPRFCGLCGTRLASGEKGCVCTACLMNLPRTGYHLLEHSPLEKLCWGKGVFVEKAVAYFHFNGAEVRNGIYSLKYFGKPDVARHLARAYAEEVMAESTFFEGITAIVPVPIHWRRKAKRGFNQSDYIAEGISDVTGIPVRKDIIKRERNNVSQTKFNKSERWINADNIFKLRKMLEECSLPNGGKPHFLIVDDVTTTGATLVSCATELIKLGDVRISLLTLALAGNRTPVQAAKNDTPDTSVFGIPLIE